MCVNIECMMYVRVGVSLPYRALLSILLVELHYCSLICQVYIFSGCTSHVVWGGVLYFISQRSAKCVVSPQQMVFK